MFGKSKSKVNLDQMEQFPCMASEPVFRPLTVTSEENRAAEMIERLITHLRVNVKSMEYKASIETQGKTIEVTVTVKSREEDTQGERP